MVSGPLGSARLGEGAAEAKMRIVVDAVSVYHRLELSRRLGELPAAKISAAQRLAYRGLIWSAAGRRGKWHRRLLKVAVLEQLDSAPIEGEGGVNLSVQRHRLSVGSVCGERQPGLPENSSLAPPAELSTQGSISRCAQAPRQVARSRAPWRCAALHRTGFPEAAKLRKKPWRPLRAADVRLPAAASFDTCLAEIRAHPGGEDLQDLPAGSRFGSCSPAVKLQASPSSTHSDS